MTGRNDPCPCGSGKKYKHCHEASDQKQAAGQRALEARLRPLLRQAAQLAANKQWLPAEQACKQVLALAPSNHEALFLLGKMAYAIGNYRVAGNHLQQALQAAGEKADAQLHLQLAMAQLKLEQLEAAQQHLLQAEKLAPRDAEVQMHLGLIAQFQQQSDRASGYFARATELKSAYHEAWLMQAMLHELRGDMADAEACFRKAAPAGMEQVLAWLNNLGNALVRYGQPRSAAVCYRRALGFFPGAPLFHRNLATVAMRLGLMDEAVPHLQHMLQQEPDNVQAFGNLLLALQYLPDISARELLQAHRQFASRFEAPQRAMWRPHDNLPDPHRRLKIGYVSGDFHDHPVSYLFEPVLESHDKSQVEVFCYYNNTVRDPVTERMTAAADHWRRCAGMADDELAAQIRADGIDILVDLSGHTAKNRLLTFVRRPAPVQVTWLGYPGTTGLAASMDYRFTDRLFDPESLCADAYAEQIYYLPRWAVFRATPDSPDVNALPALTTGQLTLACLNNPSKLNNRVIAVWARILAALPGSRLMLGNASNDDQRRDLLARFATAGVGAERLTLVPRVGLVQYLLLHHEIDLALDPFPFAGGLTTYNSLWMGVPVVTLSGGTTVSRQGSAIQGSIGLDEFVVDTEDAYVEKVIALSQNLPALDAVRQSLRERMQPVTQGGQQARDLEHAYRTIWQRWCAAQATAQQDKP